MKSWFCEEEKVNAATKIAAFDAGYLMTKNNKKLAARAMPVADGLMTFLNSGSTSEAVNSMFDEMVGKLIDEVNDEMITMNIKAVLAMVDFDIEKPTVLDNDVINSLVTSFVSGMKAVK